jgi:hypothetical protein
MLLVYLLLLILTKALKIASYIGIIWHYRPRRRDPRGADALPTERDRKDAPRRQPDPHFFVRLCYAGLLLALALELLLYS